MKQKQIELKAIQEIKSKAEAIEIATNFQSWASEKNLSYGELADYSNYFETIGRKFNLIREFKENGIF